MKFDRMFWQWIVGIMLIVWIIFSGSKLQAYQAFFNIIGLMLLFCGILGRIYATLYIGGMKNKGGDGKSFISDGVYSICRNPLYLFSFIALLGLLCLKGQITLIVVVGGLFLLIYRFTILSEERFLSHKFGESYQAFLKNTPRFFPRFKNFTYKERVEFQPFFLHKEIKRSIVWIIAGLIIHLLSYLQEIKLIPILVNVY